MNHTISCGLRSAIREAPGIGLEETVEDISVDPTNGRRVRREPVIGAEMDRLWAIERAERLQRAKESEERALSEEQEARRAIFDLYVDREETRHALHTLFPPATIYKMTGRDAVQSWVRWDGSLQKLPQEAQATSPVVGEHLFILALMENRYGRPDHAGGFWGVSTASGGSSSMTSWGDPVRSNMHLVMQNGRVGARGLFMAECEVENISDATSAKLRRILNELGERQPVQALAGNERTYQVKIIGAGTRGDQSDTVEATVHESFLFRSIPVGWTREIEIFQGASLRFKAFLPPDGVLKTECQAGPRR